MSKKNKPSINVIVPVTDPIMGTTYTTAPLPLTESVDALNNAREAYKKTRTIQATKIRSERTKKK